MLICSALHCVGINTAAAAASCMPHDGSGHEAAVSLYKASKEDLSVHSDCCRSWQTSCTSMNARVHPLWLDKRRRTL